MRCHHHRPGRRFAIVTHTKYAEMIISVFAPASTLQVNGGATSHGMTPCAVNVACWITTLSTARTRMTSQLRRRSPDTAGCRNRPVGSAGRGCGAAGEEVGGTDRERSSTMVIGAGRYGGLLRGR